MSHPVGRPGMAPTTAFGRRGHLWGCLKDAAGNGIHTGADWFWSGMHGHPVYAVEDGHVRRRNYGVAFGSKQIALSPNRDGEWFYAHLSAIYHVDEWVTAGTMIGRIGNEGNSTAPHLHLEWKRTKNSWFCGDHKDPWPEIRRLDDGVEWRFPKGHKIYLSKTVFGGHESNADGMSDSIVALQEMLNRHSLAAPGNVTIPEIGKYGPQTDMVVRADQDQHGPKFGQSQADPEGKSSVGPKQMTHLIDATNAPYAVVDDREATPEPRPDEPVVLDGMHGVDVSSHQDGIDFAKVKADHAIVKATEGSTYTSPTMREQYENAKANGLLLGLYHFARPDTGGDKADALAEANLFVDAVESLNAVGEAVLVLDWERPPLDDTAWAQTFLDRVYERTGVRAMVYMSEVVTKGADWSAIGADHPLWVAKYRDNTVDANYDQSLIGRHPDVNWPGGWTLWQWSSSGRLDGWPRNLDLNWSPTLTADDWATLAAPDAPEPPVAVDSPRFITVNWPARYKDGGLEADLALWRELTADPNVVAVGLQEAWWLYNRVLRDNVVGWTFVTARTSEDQVSGEVLAIRDSWGEIVDTGSTMISPYTDVQPEAAGPTRHKEKHIVWADVDVDGKVWYVGNVHLAPSKHLGGAIYDLWKRQRDACVEWIGRQGDLCVLLGDFNCRSDDDDAAPFRRVAHIASAPSHGKRDIDWIVVKDSPQAPIATDVRALPNRGQSDHRPVTATLVDAEEATVTRAEFEALKTQVEAVEVKVDLLAKAAKVDREVVGDVQETITSHVPAALRGLADLLEDE